MTKKQDPDESVRGMDPRIRIRIHTKTTWIRNAAGGIVLCPSTTVTNHHSLRIKSSHMMSRIRSWIRIRQRQGSGSVRGRDPDHDPHQNVKVPHQHWPQLCSTYQSNHSTMLQRVASVVLIMNNNVLQWSQKACLQCASSTLLVVSVHNRFPVFIMQHFRTGSESLYRRKKLQRHSLLIKKNEKTIKPLTKSVNSNQLSNRKCCGKRLIRDVRRNIQL